MIVIVYIISGNKVMKVEPGLITVDIATKIVEKYPTEDSLLDAYNQCKNKQEKLSLIARNVKFDDIDTFRRNKQSSVDAEYLNGLCQFLKLLGKDSAEKENNGNLEFISNRIYHCFGGDNE